MAYLHDHHRIVRETHDRIHSHIFNAYLSNRLSLAAQQNDESHQVIKLEQSEREVDLASKLSPDGRNCSRNVPSRSLVATPGKESRVDTFNEPQLVTDTGSRSSLESQDQIRSLPAIQQNNAGVDVEMSGTGPGPLPEKRRPGRPLGSVNGTSTAAPRTKLKALANHPHTHKGKAVKRILQDYPIEDEAELQNENCKKDTRLMTVQEVQEWFQKIVATTPPKPDDHGKGCLIWTGALLKNNTMPNVSRTISPKLHEGLKWNAQFKIHRIAYVAYHGKDIRGYVSQLCGNHRCINGAHIVDEGAKKHIVRASHPEGTCSHEPACIKDRDGKYVNGS